MNLGFPEMIFIFIVALLIFGPKKLPEIGRQVGKAMTEFKRASNEFKSQLDSEVQQMENEEARQRTAASHGASELSVMPPEGTIPATAAYGDALDADVDAGGYPVADEGQNSATESATEGFAVDSGLPVETASSDPAAIDLPASSEPTLEPASESTSPEVTVPDSTDNRNV
ncbi:MAG: TatA/E family twin arginine-targeting protein translocase [Candidatus Korobacteraceae bacterium]